MAEAGGETQQQPEDTRPPWVIERKHLQDELRKRVLKSISDPQNPSVCVTPYPAAVYVTNMLTVHNPDLLADLALTFAREQVEARLAEQDPLRADHGALLMLAEEMARELVIYCGSGHQEQVDLLVAARAAHFGSRDGSDV